MTNQLPRQISTEQLNAASGGMANDTEVTTTVVSQLINPTPEVIVEPKVVFTNLPVFTMTVSNGVTSCGSA